MNKNQENNVMAFINDMMTINDVLKDTMPRFAIINGEIKAYWCTTKEKIEETIKQIDYIFPTTTEIEEIGGMAITKQKI